MHRVLFEIYGYSIYTYAVMLVLGFIVALNYFKKRANRAGYPSEVPIDFSFYLIVGGILGARLVYVLLHLDYYRFHLLEIINLRAGGLSWHGAMLGGLIAGWIYCRAAKLPIWQMLDLLSPAYLLGLSLGRVGCLLNGCCYGKATNLPWGIVLPDAGISQPVHPTQLYEMLLIWVAIAFLLFWEKRSKFSGELFIASLILYSLARFAVEFSRESIILAFGLSQAQIASLVLVLLLLPYLIVKRLKS